MNERPHKPDSDQALGDRPRNLGEAKIRLALFRQAMDHVGNGIIITRATDGDNLIVYANEAFCRLSGYTQAEVIGRDCRFLQGKDTDPAAIAQLKAAIAGRTATSVVIRNYRQDGTPFWNELALSPVPSEDDQASMFIGVQIDVTSQVEAQKRLELEVARRTATLTAVNAELGEFARVVTHDLQEPLRAIGGYLSLLDERYRQGLDASGQDFLDYARESSDRVRSMLDDLLRYARLERDADDFRPVDLSGVFEEVAKNLQLQITDSQTRLEVEPLPTVWGERRQLVQLFQNLVANAITYRSQRAPLVIVSAQPDGTGQWCVTVADNGRGFDQRYAERIFQVFQQLERPEPIDASSGIGLAIALKIARAHGGSITAQSRRGVGSQFMVNLPGSDEAAHV